MTNKALHIVFILISIGILKLNAQEIKNINLDEQKSISKMEFNQLVDSSTTLLKTKALSEISDTNHIMIMMCLNTIPMALDSNLNNRFTGGRYDTLIKWETNKKYTQDIIKVYPKWIPNRGMGYYFPKLKMELYGTPRLYAYFAVKN